MSHNCYIFDTLTEANTANAERFEAMKTLYSSLLVDGKLYGVCAKSQQIRPTTIAMETYGTVSQRLTDNKYYLPIDSKLPAMSESLYQSIEAYLSSWVPADED